MSWNSGAGRPIQFACRRLNLSLIPEYIPSRYCGSRAVIATGVRRPRRNRSGGHSRMDSKHEYEYRCLECGHMGWSAHIDVARKYEKLPDAQRR